MAIIAILVTVVIIMVAIASIVFIMMVIILRSLHSTSYVAVQLELALALPPLAVGTHRPRGVPSSQLTPDVGRGVVTACSFQPVETVGSGCPAGDGHV